MATTYTLISSVTVGSGGAANIEFTSIPATYTDLNVIFSIRGSQSQTYQQLQITFNNSASNYSQRNLYGSGSSVSSSSASGSSFSCDGNGNTSTASTFSSASLYIPNYAGSNNKSASFDGVTENNATAADAELYAFLWSDSAAITSIKIAAATGTLNQYSTAYLYGISNA